ncbi:MAG TPA: hypothetical protein VHC43_15175 [Mycobacteriales bacterium]|nr:hypothetical protein [Mycobacteriales bacterium]
MRRLTASCRGAADVVLAVLAAAGLVIDAIVHLRLAGRYDPIGGTISQGDLFRVQGALALLLAAGVLAAPWRRTLYAATFVVAASAFGAVMLYRYVDVGALGPLPNMYEPVWFGQKTLSAYAEAAAAAAALAGLFRATRPDHGRT